MKNMLIDFNKNEEVRVAIVDNNELVDYESENFKNERIKGNIYLAKIVRVEPSLQAAFVDYGAKKHGFLAYNEIHPDYFKIPTADKKKLLEQEFNESQNLVISEDEDNENFIEENFSENSISESSEENEELNNKGFISKIIDFLITSPLRITVQRELKKKNILKTQKRIRQ